MPRIFNPSPSDFKLLLKVSGATPVDVTPSDTFIGEWIDNPTAIREAQAVQEYLHAEIVRLIEQFEKVVQRGEYRRPSIGTDPRFINIAVDIWHIPARFTAFRKRLDSNFITITLDTFIVGQSA